jgi:serine/threonine-protein kinase ULK2
MINLDKYTFIPNNENKLGSGGFSVVYKGTYIGEPNKFLQTNDNVAIKVLSHIKNKKKFIDNEVNIIEILKKNPHYNIIQFYDVIVMDNCTHIIMEYCEYNNLSAYVKGPIIEGMVNFWFSQLAFGLQHLYNLNILHRDIKLKNIMLTNNRKVIKIADFGLAKKVDIMSNNIKSNSLFDTICGSPLYMAPEIIRDKYYGWKSDIFSLGILLYELLYGYNPFNECECKEQIQFMKENVKICIPPEKNKNTNKQVSTDCINLLKGLLQIDVNKRITWEDFFNNKWVNKYDEIMEGLNNEYIKKYIKAETQNSNFQIIDDYYSENNSDINLMFKMDF